MMWSWIRNAWHFILPWSVYGLIPWKFVGKYAVWCWIFVDLLSCSCIFFRTAPALFNHFRVFRFSWFKFNCNWPLARWKERPNRLCFFFFYLHQTRDRTPQLIKTFVSEIFQSKKKVTIEKIFGKFLIETGSSSVSLQAANSKTRPPSCGELREARFSLEMPNWEKKKLTS